MSSNQDQFNADWLENLELLSNQVMDGVYSGRHRSQLKGGRSEFAEHRAYSPGDEVRLLDWRVFAKSDRYFIKQFEQDSDLQALFVLDASGSMGFGMSTARKLDYARAACLCLSQLVVRQGDAAGVAILGGGLRAYVPPRNILRHIENLSQTLRGTVASGITSTAEDLTRLAELLRRRSLVIVFSDCFGDVENLARTFRLLRSRRHEIVLFHVMAPEELSFPFNRSSRFECLETHGYALDVEPALTRAEYLARIEDFLNELKRSCGEAGCEYVPFPTDKPLGESLAEFLRRRAKAR